jgi:hypothetical protein
MADLILTAVLLWIIGRTGWILFKRIFLDNG